MKTVEVRSPYIGLYTDVSPMLAPPGALLTAENVVLRTPLQLEPRPGFYSTAMPAAVDTEALGRVEYPILNNSAGLLIDGAPSTRWDDTGTAVTDEAASPLSWDGLYSGQVARNSLYLTTADATRVVHTPTATVAYRAGAPAPAITAALQTAVTISGPAFAAVGWRAYRAVCRRTVGLSGQAHIMRSAPSNVFVNPATAVPRNMTVTVVLHKADDWLAGDVIELYSSETTATTVYPTDELYLNQEHALTAAEVTAGFVNILDDVEDSGLGTALYTNESRDGAEAANLRPPAANCMAVFNNSLWLGDLTYPASVLLSFRQGVPGLVEDLGTDALIGRRLMACTFTNGSATVSGVAAGDIATVKVGMMFNRDNGNGYGDQWGTPGSPMFVVSVAATSFVVTYTWGGATLGVTCTVSDAIYIGASAYDVYSIVDGVRRGTTGDYPSTYNAYFTATYAGPHPSSPLLNGGVSRNVDLHLAALKADLAGTQIWATNGHLYAPALSEPGVLPGYIPAREVLPDHVAWSNLDEPDHFRLDNVDRVGAPGSTVMALGSSRGSIIIATDKGVWRGSGYADSGISFSALDKDVRILGRRCMAEVGPYQYLAADRGVYEVDENECRSITADKINDFDTLFAAVALLRSSKLKLVPNDKHDEVIVCCPSATSINNAIVTLYVFNQNTRAWTTWVLPNDLNDLTIKGPTRQLTGCIDNQERNLLERLDSSDLVYFTDGTPSGGSEAITIATASGTSITINASTYVPVIGDAVVKSSVTYIITGTSSATAFTVHVTGLTTGAAALHRGVTSTITTTVNTVKIPHARKLWGEGALWWVKRAGIHQYDLGFQGPRTVLAYSTRILASALTAVLGAGRASAATRFLVPRSVARNTHLTFTARIRQARANWALEGVVIKAQLTTDRAPSRLD